METVQIDLRESWFIADVEVPTRLALAPMAGVSVQAFRRQGRRFGAGLVCSEMVSCAGIEHRNERTLGYLRVAEDEQPLAIQIFGSDPRVMADAARMVESAGADLVDINFGCPVRKVTKTGAGATLLDDPARAYAVVEAVATAVHVPVSVKMRRGLENGSRACLTVGPQLVEAGAATVASTAEWRAKNPRLLLAPRRPSASQPLVALPLARITPSAHAAISRLRPKSSGCASCRSGVGERV